VNDSEDKKEKAEENTRFSKKKQKTVQQQERTNEFLRGLESFCDPWPSPRSVSLSVPGLSTAFLFTASGA